MFINVVFVYHNTYDIHEMFKIKEMQEKRLPEIKHRVLGTGRHETKTEKVVKKPNVNATPQV